MQTKMGIESFSKYMSSFSSIKAKAFSWPTEIVNNPEHQNRMLKYPSKFINWTVWILLTAPKPKKEEDKITRQTLLNLLPEMLEVEGIPNISEYFEKRVAT